MPVKSNKKSGTAFENDFRRLLRKNGFWSHKLVENENGAPFDVIAVKDGRVYAFDCKECSSDRFPLNRIEDNQFTGMRSISAAGAEAFFVFQWGGSIRIASSGYVFQAVKNGLRSIKITESPELSGWLLWH